MYLCREGGQIQKQELIRVHADLVKMKNIYEKKGYKTEFSQYYDLSISPGHVHKSKDEHKKAIFVLSSALSSVVAEENETYQAAKIRTGKIIEEKTKPEC